MISAVEISDYNIVIFLSIRFYNVYRTGHDSVNDSGYRDDIRWLPVSF